LNTACIKPDGTFCDHDSKRHVQSHPLMGGYYCWGCWDGKELMGPFCHEYNPHILTMAGWLPVDA